MPRLKAWIRKRKREKFKARLDAMSCDMDRMVYSFLCTPSVREIGRALEVPKSTVHEAIVRLRAAGRGRGRWEL